jgi:hypothetical protein
MTTNRRRPRHPAKRTRRGLAIGAAIATIGLTGVYWSSELGGSTAAAGSSSKDISSSYEDDDEYESFDEDYDTYDDDTSSSVDVAPSAAAPDTSSGAS